MIRILTLWYKSEYLADCSTKRSSRTQGMNPQAFQLKHKWVSLKLVSGNNLSTIWNAILKSAEKSTKNYHRIFRQCYCLFCHSVLKKLMKRNHRNCLSKLKVDAFDYPVLHCEQSSARDFVVTDHHSPEMTRRTKDSHLKMPTVVLRISGYVVSNNFRLALVAWYALGTLRVDLGRSRSK